MSTTYNRDGEERVRLGYGPELADTGYAILRCGGAIYEIHHSVLKDLMFASILDGHGREVLEALQDVVERASYGQTGDDQC